MNKIKNFLKKYYPELLAMLIPIFIVAFASIFSDLYPFGNFTFAKYDGYYQYPGFTSYFRRVLLGQESLLYSFKGVLGYNFYATAIYYLFNPTNLLCIFFNNENLLYYYTFIVYLRIALCGLTMCKYLKYKYSAKNDIFLIIFSVCYSLMAYNICYFFNYMYYDAVVLLPLVMIGIEKIIKENKSLFYIITLTITIISNFYIGFMVCIFSLLYFIYNYILLEKEHKNKSIIKTFIFSSLLSGLMCAFVLLPVAYELLQGKADLYTDPMQTEYFKFNLNFLNMFYKFTPGSMQVYDIKYGTVNIYCSLLAIVFVIKYFFNTKITKKEKLVTLAFIIFFMLSISFNLIDFFWHFMQRPIWYPNRYIFTFSFFLISIGYKSYKYRDSIKMGWFIKSIIFFIYILLLVYPAINANFENKLIQMILIFMSVMLLFQYLFFSENKNATILLVGLFILELGINTIFTFKQLSNVSTLDSYLMDTEQHTNTTNLVKQDAKDKLFYRMELTQQSNYNNGASYGYNGISAFNSLRNGKVMDFFDLYFNFKVSDSASIKHNNNNPYLLSILGVEYINGYINETYYDLIGNSGFVVYKNSDALGLGFMANNTIFNHKFKENDSYYNTKVLIDTMTNKNNKVYSLLNNYELHNLKKVYDDNSKTYKIQKIDNNSEGYVIYNGIIEKDMFLVFNTSIKSYASTTITIDGEIINGFMSNNTMPLFLEEGSTYEIKMTSLNPYDASYLNIYSFEYKTYKNFISEMKKNLMEVYEYEKDNHLKATVTATSNKNALFTSIPYDKGWKVYVDGKKTEYKSCYDAFICLELSERKHDIEFKYTPKYLMLGIIISLMSLVTTIFYVNKKQN